MNVDFVDSPFGKIKIEAIDNQISSISTRIKGALSPIPSDLTEEAKQQLSAYFKGDLQVFDLPLNFDQGSEFFQRVWSELLKIPYGKTVSYLHIARALGDEKSVRAVGMANGKNPIAIVVPCHRVIGSNGSLVGYASGLDMKRRLLALENPREYAINGSLFS